MKNSQKGFIVPLLIAIIAVLGIGGGSYVYVQKKKINSLESEKKTVEDKIVATTTQINTSDQASSDSPKVIKCNFANFAPGAANCISDMSPLDLERENKAIEILAKEKIVNLTGVRYLHGQLIVSDPQYQVISIPSAPKYKYLVVDTINKKVTDSFGFVGFELVIQDNKKIVFLAEDYNIKSIFFKQYIYGTEKLVVIPNSTLFAPQTYFCSYSAEGSSESIKILSTATESITLGICDRGQKIEHPEQLWTEYGQIGTKVIDLTK